MQASLENFVRSNKALLSIVPGDHYQGDLSGHGDEWKAKFVVDYCLTSDEDEDENENEYILVLSVYNAESLTAKLTLEYHVFEAGCEEIHCIPVTNLADTLTDFVNKASNWGMHKGSPMIAKAFFEAVFNLKQGATNIQWAS